MLILSREKGERIIIQDGPHTIVVVVVEVLPWQVRLGFQAPRSISINREEVQKRIDNAEFSEGIL